MNIRKLALTLMLLCTAIGGHAASGDHNKGKAQSAVCAACHGVDGNSINGIWPKLAGQHAGYIVKQLQDYKSGTRENAIMAGMVAALSEQDMLDLAAYFSSQNIKPGTADQKLAELGEKIYRTGISETGVPACMSCHGPAGMGNPAALYPALSGQHKEYIEAQMQLWKTGKRANDKDAVMRTVAGPITSEQIKAVASYLQGLR